MIEWLVGFLVAKYWIGREEREQEKEIIGNVECTISFGYVREEETVQDLQ